MLDLLAEAKQEMPGFLESVAADGRMPSSGRRGGKGRYGGGGFGGRDYRQQSGGMQRNPRSGGGYGNNGYGGGESLFLRLDL